MSAARSGASERGLTREVLDLALPAIAGGIVLMGYQWTNQYWVKGLGSLAAAAMTIAMFTIWAFGALSALVGSGLTAVVARYVGAGRHGAAAWSGMQGVRWAWVFSAVVAVAGVFLAPSVYAVANASGEMTRIGTPYVQIAYGCGVFSMTQVACDAVFRAHGNTRTPFVIAGCGLVANAALDPLLIFGWGPVPGLGVAGSAIATALATAGTAIVSFRLLSRRGLLSSSKPTDDELRLDPRTPLDPGPWPALDASMGRRLARVGLPVAVTGVTFVLIYLGLSRVVEDAGGDEAVAGLGVGLRGEQVAFFLGSGFALAAASLVGRRLGAGSPGGAARAAWRAALLCAAACLVWSLALAAFPKALSALFLPPTAARGYAADYFTIVALCLVPQCFEVVLDGAFSGAGLTIPPMVISVLITGVRIPVARWAAFDLGMGVTGIWWVIAATAALRGVVVAVWFSRGTWKTRSV